MGPGDPKHAAFTKGGYFGMLFFALAGAAAGMPVGMQQFSSDPIYGRLELKIGALCVVCGLIAGSVLGAIVWTVVSVSGRGRSLAQLSSLLLMCAFVGINIGWFYQQRIPADNWSPRGGSGRLWGGILGVGVGLVIWVIEVCWLHEFSEKPKPIAEITNRDSN